MTEQEARDEAAELIALAKTFRASLDEDPAPGSILGLWMRTARALEATQHPEPEIEYGIQFEGDSEPWSDYSDDLDWLLEHAADHMGMSDYAVKRTKAGPWEPVS